MDFAAILRDADTETLVHGVGGCIVIPGEPVGGGEGMVGERHHLGIAGATDYCFLPDDPQGRDDLLIPRAGGADDTDGTGVDGIVHAHTGTGSQGEAVLHATAHTDFDGVVPGAIDTGDASD